MARSPEQTNLLVDRIATVAAVLSVGEKVYDATRALMKLPPIDYTPTNDYLCRSADRLIEAAAEYLGRRDARERAEVRGSEPGAMPENTGKYQPQPRWVDSRELDLFAIFLARVAEVRASGEGGTTTIGEVYDEVYRGGVGANEPDRMRKNAGKHPEHPKKRSEVMAEAVAKVFWEDIQKSGWDRDRYLLAAKYMDRARAALEAAFAAARKAGA